MALLREYKKLMKNIDSVSDGQARILPVSDDLSTLFIEVKPKDGYYHGGTFVFRLQIPETFPQDPPDVCCMTPIYHPNIYVMEDEDDDTNICFNMFDEWVASYGLDGCVNGILFVLNNPVLDDSFSPLFDEDVNENDFVENVRKSLYGCVVANKLFPVNYDGVIPLEYQNRDSVDKVGVETDDGNLVEEIDICIDAEEKPAQKALASIERLMMEMVALETQSKCPALDFEPIVRLPVFIEKKDTTQKRFSQFLSLFSCFSSKAS